jgi:hypothetical protein
MMSIDTLLIVVFAAGACWYLYRKARPTRAPAGNTGCGSCTACPKHMETQLSDTKEERT